MVNLSIDLPAFCELAGPYFALRSIADEIGARNVERVVRWVRVEGHRVGETFVQII